MRKYNYGSILLILIVNAIIAGILENIFDGKLSALVGFVVFIADYIICRGLLYNREGSFSDYFKWKKPMSLNSQFFLFGAIVEIWNIFKW